MLKIFFDTSVLFAALYSKTGSAHDLLELAYQKQVDVVLTQNILREIERNIEKKIPGLHNQFHEAITRLNPEVVALPENDRLIAVAAYVAAKDVHVIAAAIAAQPDYLVTYDRKHLLDVPEVAVRSGLKIVTPDVIVKLLEDQG